MPFVSGQPRLAWLLAFALTVAGWISAHEIAYRLALPHPHASGSDVAHARHAYFAYASLAVVLCLLVAVLCAASLARREHRLPTPSRRLLLVFVVLPPLGFALQELTESLLTTGALPFAAVLEPAFLVGVLLQAPFALGALVVANVLFAFARSLARTVAGTRRPRLASLGLSLPPVVDAWLPRLPALAFGYGERGPPPCLAA
jgi:predicted neutral ceramidase superfamily lipid hydrolase